jgi:heptosyltransferase-2
VTRTIPVASLRRVLVRCPNWLGDTVMAVPVVRALRAAVPAAEIWCRGPWVETVLDGEPAVDRRLPWRRGWRAAARAALELRSAEVDLAVILPNSLGTAIEAYAAGIRWRVGHAGDGRSGLLTHAVPPAATILHQVDAYLRLLGPLGIDTARAGPTLHVSAAQREEARRLRAHVGLAPGAPSVAIQLGAAFGPSKLWPAARLAELAAQLGARRVSAVFLGAPDAMPLLRAVERALGTTALHLVGQDHPALLPALLAEFSVIVAPDSGPAHVAAAVGVPVVTLFGPTDPRLTAPVGHRQAALWQKPPCAPCFLPRCPIDHRCMTALPVDLVVRAVLERLAPAAPPAASP